MAPRVGEHLAWLGPREDHVHDGKDSEQVVTPAEGVRILGAEEAHAALAADRDEGDEPEDREDRDDGTQPTPDLSDAVDPIVRRRRGRARAASRSEEHTSEIQSRVDLVCRVLLDNK